MKLIFGFLMFAVAAVVAGGPYLLIRKPDQRKTDLEKLQMLLGKIAHRILQAGEYLSNLFGSKSEAINDKPTAAPTAPAA